MRLQPPVFGIGLETAPLVAIQPGSPGAFQDALVSITDGRADVCFYSKSFSPSPPIINSLEILEVRAQDWTAGRRELER